MFFSNKKAITFIILGCFSITVSSVNQRASFSYEASKNSLEAEIINDLRESGIANAVIDFINEKFLLS